MENVFFQKMAVVSPLTVHQRVLKLNIQSSVQKLKLNQEWIMTHRILVYEINL